MDGVSLLHLGALHPYEQALTLLLAFGPFVVLGIVVWRRSKEDEAQPARTRTSEAETPAPVGDDVAQRD